MDHLQKYFMASTFFSRKSLFSIFLNNKALFTLKSSQNTCFPSSYFIKSLITYSKNRPYHYRYQKSKNPDQYFRNHDMQKQLENIEKYIGISKDNVMKKKSRAFSLTYIKIPLQIMILLFLHMATLDLLPFVPM